MVLITHFKSSSLQDDDHSVNYGPFLSETEEKAGYSLECGYFVTLTHILKGLATSGWCHGGSTLG